MWGPWMKASQMNGEPRITRHLKKATNMTDRSYKQTEKHAPWRKKRLDMEKYLPEKRTSCHMGKKKIFRKQKSSKKFKKKKIPEIKNSIEGL